MNRKVFMERLRECLADISAEEREDALTYYESYLKKPVWKMRHRSLRNWVLLKK